MTRDEAIAFELDREGGELTELANDPGGLTRWGIALRRHPELTADDIRNMTRERAAGIYAGPEYWGAVQGDRLPAFLALPMLDACVNQGPATAIRCLQEALRLPADGLLGPLTLGAASAGDPRELAATFTGRRIAHYSRLDAWPTDGVGWATRATWAALAAA